MSIASSIPCIKLPTSSPSTCCSCSSPSLRMTHHHAYSSKPCMSMPLMTIRSSQTEGPIRRPVAPSPPSRPSPPSASPPPPPPPPSPSPPRTVEGKSSVITLEFQRAKARELQEYFKQKKIEETNQGPAFGFFPKNEISNGRWAMFGFAVGMLTEYATGSDFVDQLKLILSNLGIVDLE